MSAVTITLSQLGHELRDLPKRDKEALRRAIKRTVEVDAHRWIQWSINGGGRGGAPRPRPAKPAKPPRAGAAQKQKACYKPI